MSTAKIEKNHKNNIFPSTLISDSFEAVTNGMSNPEVLSQLEMCRDDEALRDWYLLIKSIQAFYSQDFFKMQALLNKLTEKSCAIGLKRILLFMSGISEDVKLTKNEERLADKVTANSRFLKNALSELKESIVYGDEVFIETVSLLIKEIKKKSIEASEKLALWAFRKCLKEGISEESLADNIIMLFGQAEGLRLIALSFIENDPVTAFICFTRSLLARLDDDTINSKEISAYIEIIETLSTHCPKCEQAEIDIYELLNLLHSELVLFYNLNSTQADNQPEQKIKKLKQQFKPQKKKILSLNKTSLKTSFKKDAIQLELF